VTSRFQLLAGFLTTTACGTPPAPAASPTSDTEPSPTVTAERPPGTPVLTNCVMHAGQGDTSQRREKKVGGELGASQVLAARCSFDAECVARRGESNPGDGFAYLSCTEGHCSCRLEPLFPAGSVVEWQFESACATAEQARQLLRDRCLKGIDVAE
jgi:hypothetical protein